MDGHATPAAQTAAGPLGEGDAGEDEPPSSLLARLLRRLRPAADPSEPPPPEPGRPPALADLARRAALDERAMLLNVIAMREQRVEDVMIPRADIVAAPDTATLDQLVEMFREASLTRIPVFRETLDDPVGFLHLKDLAFAYGFDGDQAREGFSIERHLRPLLYVPPSMTTAKLLERMQTSRKHMALVIDEYGGVDGLVTIEDLVEQIVGDIEDEHDDADPAPWRREAPGVYVCNARADLEAFEAETGVSLLAEDLAEDVDTLGGLVFMLSNRVPERGEVIAHPDGHEFEVIDADPRRIKRLRVTLAGAAARPDAA
ncbi:MAG: hemolysin family protein [Rubrimonas sp.]|uniref:hemolysin family protein n=1 Tax=Rubrimonas sp. TaxID=2036015 RepID=UPI002FDD450E